MNKHVIIFIILVILWGVLFVRNTKAEAPLLDVSVPLEVQDNPIKEFAYNQVKLRWDESQWSSFNNIIERESQWNPKSQNPTSTAYGLGQFLNSTWQGTGYTKTDDPQVQIMATIEYIADRYETPKQAWIWWSSHLWY